MTILNNYNKIIPIPESFILNVMPNINSTYANIYIYAYTKSYLNHDLSTDKIAKDLKLLESDVISAFEEFKNMNLITLSNNSYVFSTNHDLNQTVTVQNEPKVAKKIVLDSKPNYSSEEIQIYADSNEEISHLFLSAQENLGKLLTKNDLSIIFSFYDWLRMPLELIEFLIVYCSENNHTNIRYIEKIAIDWHNNGITTLNKAKEYINRFNIYRNIFKAYGINSREPNQSEIKIMDKWIFEYNMPFELIECACEKTISQTHKASLNYTDKILEDWNKKGVMSITDIDKLDENFTQSKTYSSITNKQKIATKFSNFKHGEIDFDEIRRIKEKQLES